MMEPAAATTTDAQLGRQAAEHLAHSWPEMDGLTELAAFDLSGGRAVY